MRPNKIKELWRQGKPASVGWISSGNTLIAEVLAHAGFDGIVVDMQHGMALNADKAVACMQAISTTETVPIVRVPWNDPKEIQTVLDAGAYGIIVPLVNTYEEAAQAAAAADMQARQGLGTYQSALGQEQQQYDQALKDATQIANREAQFQPFTQLGLIGQQLAQIQPGAFATQTVGPAAAGPVSSPMSQFLGGAAGAAGIMGKLGIFGS